MSFYKGKTTIEAVLQWPYRFFYKLYTNLLKASESEEGKKKIAAEQMKDQFDEMSEGVIPH